jgi:hypothetical protein
MRGTSGPERLAEEMLTEAYEFVLAGWCQGAAAVDELGRPVEPSSAFARKWSVPGALARVWLRGPMDGESLEAFQRANLALATAVRGVPQEWNDAEGRTLPQALDALAEAVQRLAEIEALEVSLLPDATI